MNRLSKLHGGRAKHDVISELMKHMEDQPITMTKRMCVKVRKNVEKVGVQQLMKNVSLRHGEPETSHAEDRIIIY
uniref:TFIIS central domain-containing protein n=1 Tax=Ascaris lumbricoides TaxID=6252 RepID=A0A0M3HP17_ASCLU